ncbi:MAG TPA: DUF2948 family protein [Hyphomicrobiaceae bacterium]|nr:DUF2948 family protein [Hyphomicrobiaceae bacterium]
MDALKLIALDAEDLAVVSAHLQDAVVAVNDMAYLPRAKRFALIASRFDWCGAQAAGSDTRTHMRCRTALRFERVLGAKLQGIDRDRAKQALCLLALQFEPGEAPGGFITLIFAGQAAIRLEVECIEAELKDLGETWPVSCLPCHPTDDKTPPT